MNLQPRGASVTVALPSALFQKAGVSFAPALQPNLDVRIIVFKDEPQESLFTVQNLTQWMNVYPSMQTIAIGEKYAAYPTHSRVHTAFLATLMKEPRFEATTPDGEKILAFQLGKDVVIPIGNHQKLLERVQKDDPSTDDKGTFDETLASYRRIIGEASALVKESRGSIIAIADDSPQAIICNLIDSRIPIDCRASTHLLPIVNGYVDGTRYILRIEPLPQDWTPKDAVRLAEMYERAIQIANSCAPGRDGVRLEAAGDTQKLIAKLLGRLDQVVDPGQSVANAIRKKIKTSASGHYLYKPSTGTRYYFPDDLLTIAETARRSSPEDQQRLKNTVGELAAFLTTNNLRGNREGQIFLVDHTGQSIESRSHILDYWATRIEDAASSIELSTDWSAAKERIADELLDIATRLKQGSHPDFHRIPPELCGELRTADGDRATDGLSLTSKRAGDPKNFVDLVSRFLRSSSSDLDLGADFSTPLAALEFGFFHTSQDGQREFLVTSQDPQHQAIARYLFSNEGSAAICRASGLSHIAEADIIGLAKADSTPISHEPHPTKVLEQFGHVEVDGFVLEVGKLGQESTYWVLEGNPWSIDRWDERNTETIRTLLYGRGPNSARYSPAELSYFVKVIKDAQQELLNSILRAMPGTAVALAPAYEWISIQNFRPGELGFENVRIRPFVKGARADMVRTEFGHTTMQMLGDLMAASIIAQIPHLPRRDIILSTQAGEKDYTKLVLLSSGESFCHWSRLRDKNKYLKEFVPRLCGNHIARDVTAIGYPEAITDPKVAKQERKKKQMRLLETCVKQIAGRLKQISKDRDCEGMPLKVHVTSTMHKVLGKREDAPSEAPKELNIDKFLPFSAQLLSLEKEEIHAIAKEIKAAAIWELELIESIAPPPPRGASLEQWSEVEACADAISSLIERHLLDSRQLKIAIKGLTTLAKDLGRLSVDERAWYISVLDVAMRIAELKKAPELAKTFVDTFKDSKDEKEFYWSLMKKASLIDLSYETVTSCYRAINGLRDRMRWLGKDNPKRAQFNRAVRLLRPLDTLFTA